MSVHNLTRPIVGIENRTAQEVFDIMRDRILSALEPPAARKLALEEAFKAGAEWADECGSGESPYLEIAAKEYAIRALGTSCEQLNKAVSNVPDQQENEPGAHGERERALEELVRAATSAFNAIQHYAETNVTTIAVSQHLNTAIEAAIRALSSPDHNADAGKLVEGDGWKQITDGLNAIGFEIGGCYILKLSYDTLDQYEAARATIRSALPSAPSQEVAGS
ncbi:tRNA threonylcarbamoyladenosine modification (KEOPS) complex Cgi121 subunit [Ochrobactrum sp. RH1CCR137]|nr:MULTISPECIES: hypothetical protein [unclassified Ochrobactrum]MBA8846218.1 tRNA threonylcarbamoyladenosine modification (KEOPS) complex Cgi121 subunit [Ochrobactrum sp. RH1CCR137]MBA8858037.1 tRNA threonylcarbamoyladenosine modification (KEOPS) complex Cgi121 subunit [Ochrobactrum sp. RH1CCR134]